MPKLSALLLITCLVPGLSGQTPGPAGHEPSNAKHSEIDKDLFEVTVPQLEKLYASHKYTVTQVVQWHLARIHRYNGIYRAVEQVLEKEALAAAAKEDAEAASGTVKRGPLWGVPIVIKANTS